MRTVRVGGHGAWLRNVTVAEDADAVLAVVAHGLINAAYPALMAGLTLQRHDLSAESRAELLAIVVDRTRIVVDTLHDLLRGVPPDLFDTLEALSTREVDSSKSPAGA